MKLSDVKTRGDMNKYLRFVLGVNPYEFFMSSMGVAQNTAWVWVHRDPEKKLKKMHWLALAGAALIHKQLNGAK